MRAALTEWLTDPRHRTAVAGCLVPRADVALHLPFEVADYVDFYASEHHASNVGRIFRPDVGAAAAELEAPADRLPRPGRHRRGLGHAGGTARAGSARRPATRLPSTARRSRLDIEAEVGFVVGTPSPLGERVPLAGADATTSSGCAWSTTGRRATSRRGSTCRSGPFLGKSFATSVSPWVVPLDALAHARTAPPARDPEPLPYLDDRAAPVPYGLDLALEVRLNGHVVSRPPFASMYWTYAQMLAHMTVNGASLRTGDLFASGTVSGPEPDTRGALIELTWNGESPLTLPDGTRRAFLEDGDEVAITATAPGPDGGRIGLGEVRGRVLPARP